MAKKYIYKFKCANKDCRLPCFLKVESEYDELSNPNTCPINGLNIVWRKVK